MLDNQMLELLDNLKKVNYETIDIDDFLDQRECDPFDSEWVRVYQAIEELKKWTIVNKVDTIYKEKCRVQLLSAVPSTILLFHLVSSFRENYAVSWHYRILRCIRTQITGVPAENDMFYG